MNYTKADQVEKAVTDIALTMVEATLKVIEDPKMKLSDSEKKAFATGVMCAIDGMRMQLVPKLKEIVKENPRFFENLN